MKNQRPLFRDMGMSNLVNPQLISLLPIWMMHQCARFASVKYGGGITQMSGSIAGTVFARNRFGNYCRPRTKPVNPNSALQTKVRNVLSSVVQRWHVTLTPAQRIAWNTYAASIAMKNRLGEVMYCTGFNHYLRSNSLINRHLLAFIDEGPTELSLPETDSTFTILPIASTQKIKVDFDIAQPWWSDNAGYLFVYQGQPQLKTRNFFGGPWKHAGNVSNGQATGIMLDPSFTIVVGQKIWCYARVIRGDGRVSSPFVASAVVIS